MVTDFGRCTDKVFYKSTYTNGGPYDDVKKWKPSIHMPRWASRINLEIANVRVERLQDISEEDAECEGARQYDPTAYFTIGEMGGKEKISDWEYRAGFADLWNSVYGNWTENPWVWVIEFKKLDVTERKGE